jgi:hypothetical protein
MDYDFGNNGDVFRVATASKNAIWNGSDAAAGAAGDGSSWADAQNWTRGGLVDVAFNEHDDILFAPSIAPAVINLGADRTAAAVTFATPHVLEGHALQLLSGNVTVEEGVAAVVRSDLIAESPDDSIRKLGAGTLLVEGNAGQIAVNEGTLGGTGVLDHLTVRNEGTAAPGGFNGPAGVLTVNRSFTMHEDAALAVDIGGRSNDDPQIPQFDQLVVGTEAKLDGTLTVDLFDLGDGVFEPAIGDSFPVLSAGGGIAGSFDILELPPLSPALAWQTLVDGTTFYVIVTSRVPGDYNADGIVNAADYVVWRRTFGQSGLRPAADGTGQGGAPDGVVDELDYNFWRANFGNTSGGAATALNVPEPGWSGTLVVIVSIVAIFRLRRD